MPKATPFDVADYLDDAEMIAEYLNEALASGDAALVTKAVGNVARAKGMTSVAKEAGVTREALYRSLSESGRPEFATVMKSLNALGIRLQAVSARTAA